MGKKLSQIEKEYGIDFGVKNDIELSAYLRKQGFPSLAKCLEILDMKKKTSPKMKPVKAWAIVSRYDPGIADSWPKHHTLEVFARRNEALTCLGNTYEKEYWKVVPVIISEVKKKV